MTQAAFVRRSIHKKLRFAAVVVLTIVVIYTAVLLLWRPAIDISGVPAQLPPSSSEIPPESILFCLSGGGYRAMLYHAGALIRLNEMALLPKITQISSVSGGSLTAAMLALHWKDLHFSEPGTATDLIPLVVEPLEQLANVTIDQRAILWGLATPQPAARYLADQYATQLFGTATLSQLPDLPRFVFHATDLNAGRDWMFSKDRIGNSEVGFTYNPNTSLALTAAASSAFPPFLSPLDVVVRGGTTSGRRANPEAVVSLADGGVVDNLGLEEALNFETILVSDASGRSAVQRKVPSQWLGQIQRVIDVIYDQPGDLRIRKLIEQYFNGYLKGTLWAIRLDLSAYNHPPMDTVCDSFTHDLAALPTRLAALPKNQQKALVNWGYISAAASLDYRFKQGRRPEARLPYPDVPLCSSSPPVGRLSSVH